jgi:prolyl-tRNA editing enzyme YbaK/EbsC (Cys-tRNA(Pro) deacylase)
MKTKLRAILNADVRAAEPGELSALTGADAGSIGPIGLKAKFRISCRQAVGRGEWLDQRRK